MTALQLEMGRGYARPLADDIQQGRPPSRREALPQNAEQRGFGPSSIVKLSGAARQILAGTEGPTAATTQSLNSPGTNPDGTVTTVDEVVIVGERRTLFIVSFPNPPPYNPEGLYDELDPNVPEIPVLTPCQKETAIDRAAMEAAKILEDLPSNKEWGMYLVRDPDGSIRGVGPIEGHNVNGENRITWDATREELGITSWSQVVGLTSQWRDLPIWERR